MLIPLGTDRPLRRATRVNSALILANIAVFVADLFLSATAPDQRSELYQSLWLDPRALTLHGFFTYQFLHGGFIHLIGNMIFLYVFGPNVEDRFGRIGYLAFYLLGGVGAGLAHALFVPNPVVGASGSIAAVTGAYLVLFPKTYIRTLLFFIVIGVFNIPAPWLIGFAIAKDLFLQGFGGGRGVAHLAHLGGYGFGVSVALFLLATRILERESYDLFSIGKQLHRRRSFKRLAKSGAEPWSPSPDRPPRISKSRRREHELDAKTIETRTKVSRLHASGDFESAARAYADLLDAHPELAMHRRIQLDVANQLFKDGDHTHAATAYTLFLDRNPDDPETPRVKLMLGLLYARYLDQPEQAAELLRDAEKNVRMEEERSLAQSLLQDLEDGSGSA